MRLKQSDMDHSKRSDSGDKVQRTDFYRCAPDFLQTGLIGSPKKLTKSEKNSGNAQDNSSKNKAQAGWEIRYFLNAAIGVNDLIQLQSKAANGIFRVESVKLEGDNMAGVRRRLWKRGKT